jgi:hypothetical protein
MFQNPNAKVRRIKRIQVIFKKKLSMIMICGMPGIEMVEIKVIVFDFILDHFVFLRPSAFRYFCK